MSDSVPETMELLSVAESHNSKPGPEPILRSDSTRHVVYLLRWTVWIGICQACLLLGFGIWMIIRSGQVESAVTNQLAHFNRDQLIDTLNGMHRMAGNSTVVDDMLLVLTKVLQFLP